MQQLQTCGSGKTRQGGQLTATAGLQRRIKRHLARQQSQTIFQRGWTAKISWSLSGCNVRRLLPDNHNLLLIRKVHNGSPSVTPGKQPRLDYGKWRTLRNAENYLTSTFPSLYYQMTNSFQLLAMASRLTATSRLWHLSSWGPECILFSIILVFTISNPAKACRHNCDTNIRGDAVLWNR